MAALSAQRKKKSSLEAEKLSAQATCWSYEQAIADYEDMKPTIITTNYNADELVRALTPKGGDGTKARAIISRLREVSTVITMAWADYRAGGGRRNA